MIWKKSFAIMLTGNMKIQSTCVAPATPVVGTITQPSCSVSTGSVVLSSLPATGTWTITRTPGNTTSTGTGTTKSITGLAAGTYTFTVTNAEGCVSAASANVVVNQPALPSPPVVGNISNNSVTLNGLPSSGTWTITRTPGNINYSGSGVSYNVTPLNPGSYTFTVTNSSGCTSPSSAPVIIGTQSASLTIATADASPGNSITVPVNAKGISNLVGFQFTIEYDKENLTYANISNWANGITGVTVSTPQEGKITFVYADPNLKINIADAKFFDINFTVKKSASGSAGLSWTDSPTARSLINYDLEEISSSYVNGSVKIQSSCVAPAAPLVGIITHPTCSTATGSFMLSGLPQTGVWILTMNPGGITTSGTGISKTITGLAPGTYSFTVTNVAGCVSESSVNVIINEFPSPTAPIIGNITTNSAELSGLPSSGTWTITRIPGDNTYKGTGSTYNVTPLNPGSYTFTVTNSSGCTSLPSSPAVIGSQSVSLTIGTVDASSGSSFSLAVTAKRISNLVGFQFTIDYDKDKLTFVNISNWASGITGVTISTPLEGKITFVYADPNLKINIPDGKFFDINFIAKDRSSYNTQIEWSDNPTAKSLIDYDLEEINCNYFGGIISVITYSESFHSLQNMVYPNPFGNFIRIENHEKVTRIKITNVLGQTVIDSENPQHFTNTEKLTDGIYFITLFGKDDVLKSVKMVKNSR
jgi:hypothetical protein